MTPAVVVLAAALATRQPAVVTPLAPGELREIGVEVEGPTRADWCRRWGAFGRGYGYGYGGGRLRGGFGRYGGGYGRGGYGNDGHRGGGRGRR